MENTTPSSSSSSSTDSNGVAKKKTSNELNFARKRRLSNKIHSNGLSNENPRQTSTNDPIDPQIDDELLQRLSQGSFHSFSSIEKPSFRSPLDFVYVDPQTGIRWIGRKARAKSLTSLVSRFSWKPKINHYEKYSDIIRSSKSTRISLTRKTKRRNLSFSFSSKIQNERFQIRILIQSKRNSINHFHPGESIV